MHYAVHESYNKRPFSGNFIAIFQQNIALFWAISEFAPLL